MNYWEKLIEGFSFKFQSIEEFITIAGIDMYLKHFLGFKLMNDLFPENILLLKYEDMIQDPEKNLHTVLNFLSWII